MPETPKGWLRWSAYVLEAQGRPFSPRYHRIPGTDFRLLDSRETALSVKILLERASNGAGGAELLYRFYVHEAPWISFTGREQRLIAITARRFARGLREAGFLPGEG